MRTIPNIISAFRICLVPIFIATYFSGHEDAKMYAAFIYVAAAISDFLDGFIARRFKVTTNLGKVLDPLGDKMMMISAMACLTIDGMIPIPLVLVAGVKELLMGIGGLVIHKKAHAAIPPSNIVGKASTVVFFIVLVTLMLFRDIPQSVATALVIGAIALMLLALLSYVGTYISVMKKR
jgi:CDP-diacylglycerol--glycerol-3-phosphate 3-phosphatidyltransferase